MPASFPERTRQSLTVSNKRRAPRPSLGSLPSPCAARTESGSAIRASAACRLPAAQTPDLPSPQRAQPLPQPAGHHLDASTSTLQIRHRTPAAPWLQGLIVLTSILPSTTRQPPFHSPSSPPPRSGKSTPATTALNTHSERALDFQPSAPLARHPRGSSAPPLPTTLHPFTPYPTRSLSLGSRTPGYPIRDGNHVLEAYEEYVALPVAVAPAGSFLSQPCVLPRSAPPTARLSLTTNYPPSRTQGNPSGPANQHILSDTLDVDDNGQGGQEPVRLRISHPHRREQHPYVRPTRPGPSPARPPRLAHLADR